MSPGDPSRQRFAGGDGLLGLRPFLRRLRRRARLARARNKVLRALADGRISPAVATALTGHLDALQRDIARARED